MFVDLIAECRALVEKGGRTRSIKPLSTAQQLKQADDIGGTMGNAEQHREYDLGGSGAIFTQPGEAQRFHQTGQTGVIRKIGKAELWKRSRRG